MNSIEEFKSDIAKLCTDSWDQGWKAACESFVEIADSQGVDVAIAAMRSYLEQ